MNLAWFRFYEELNELLPSEKRKNRFSYSFNGSPSIKDAIEALGVPHTEVDLILINNLSVDFSYKLRNGDSVSVYPVFESFDITSVSLLKKKPLRDLKFILDVHLGRLAKYLRFYGFDTCYRTDFNDRKIIDLSLSDKRIILTRDIGMLKNREVIRGYCVRSQYLDEQLLEVFKRFNLKNLINPFCRCTKCNGLLIDVPKKEIMDRLLPGTRKYYKKFKKCSECDSIYWKGSHYERVKKYIYCIIKDIT